jgi:predicted membrane protein
MPNSQPKQITELNPIVLTQLSLELVVIVGYVIGILGSLFLAYYALVAWWLIPLTIAIVLLSLAEETGSDKLNIANFVCALLTLVPVLQFLPATIGIVLSAIAIFQIFPNLTRKVTIPLEQSTVSENKPETVSQEVKTTKSKSSDQKTSQTKPSSKPSQTRNKKSQPTKPKTNKGKTS